MFISFIFIRVLTKFLLLIHVCGYVHALFFLYDFNFKGLGNILPGFANCLFPGSKSVKNISLNMNVKLKFTTQIHVLLCNI